jgi:DNA-binding transcriptional LysR family regulator
VLIGGGEPGIRRHYDEWLTLNERDGAVAMEHDSSLGMLAAVKAGAGIAALPCLVADREPDLIRCLTPAPQHDRALWLVTHERLRDSPRIRATLDFLAPKFAELRPVDQR